MSRARESLGEKKEREKGRAGCLVGATVRVFLAAKQWKSILHVS